jgi:hypothetical protein
MCGCADYEVDFMKRTHRIERTDKQQLPTVTVSIEKIMALPWFAQGVADARAKRPFPRDYDTWAHEDKSWSYERGRFWGSSVPRSVR